MKRTTVPLLLISMAMIFQACGPSKVENELDQASRIQNPPANDGLGGSSSTIYAYCSQNSKAPLQVAASAVSTSLGEVDINYSYAKILALNSDFEENEDYIQFFKWKATSDGIVYQDPTPLYFHVVDEATRTPLTSQILRSANWNQLAGPATYVSATTVHELLEKAWFRIELKDPYGDFDVLRMNVYSKDHKAKYSIDVLLPVFPARPSEYAIERDGSPRSVALKKLHPLRSKSSEEGNLAHFRTLAVQLCRPFDY